MEISFALTNSLRSVSITAAYRSRTPHVPGGRRIVVLGPCRGRLPRSRRAHRSVPTLRGRAAADPAFIGTALPCDVTSSRPLIADVRPDARDLGFPGARREHRIRRVIGVQVNSPQHVDHQVLRSEVPAARARRRSRRRASRGRYRDCSAPGSGSADTAADDRHEATALIGRSADAEYKERAPVPLAMWYCKSATKYR